MLRNLISSLFFVVVIVFCGVSFGATICVDIPDEQIPYVQVVATREKTESVQAYLQNVITSAVNSWQKQQDDEKLAAMKNMLQALSPASQVELIAALQAKAAPERVTP